MVQDISKMETTQTPVEWLVEQLEKHNVTSGLKDNILYRQAIDMEKKHINLKCKYCGGEDRGQ